MPETLLQTKLYIPPLRPNLVSRPYLIERLNQGLQLGHKLTLISAPAGFGKTTLVSEWVAANQRPAAWLSLDEGDSDPTRFMAYLVAALQKIAPNIGEAVLGVLQSPQPPPTESILTSLLNEITSFPDNFILVLDDYHVIVAKPLDDALTFLLEHLPPQMHLVIATRDDPHLPLARLRASSLIESFTGSHRFVLDYLIEEVLELQSESVQTFLLETAILDRLTGSLCDTLTGQDNGQATLETLERANLFIVPLDEERRWYRYHHLFADLLRQRLGQSSALAVGDDGKDVDELHRRASIWYEENGQEIEAFRRAAAANDVERAARLVEGDGMPLTLRGEAARTVSCCWPFTVISLKRNASSFQYAQSKDWLPLKQAARSWADRKAVVTRKECSTRTASKLKNISSWDYLCGGFEPLSTRNWSGLLVTRPIDTLSGKIQSCFNRGRDGALLLKPPSLSASIS